MDRSAPVLVADIGGTNARFALSRRAAGGGLVLEQIRSLEVASHASLAIATAAYLREVGQTPGHAVFAVASRVGSDTVKLTNSPWTFSIAQLRADLNLDALDVVNDFAALSMAIPQLAADDVEAIGLAEPPALQREGHRSYATIGPGTGLGVGGLLIRAGRAAVVESEGGHAGFAPADAYELEILRQLWRDLDRVSNERLISGFGMLNLYRAVCTIEGVPAEFDTPSAITAAADTDPDGICGRTLLRFCAILGSVAGDVALVLGAWDGVYLGGGIAQRLAPWLRRSAFRNRFESKGRHAPLMKAIPTLGIRHSAVGLLGAAACAAQMRD